MNPSIGTRYLEMSQEGLCLDVASVVRLKALANGKKPQKPVVSDPKPPRYPGNEVLVKRFQSGLQRAIEKREILLGRFDAFCNVQFCFRTSRIDGYPKVSQRIYAMVECDGLTHLADIVTGSLFTEAGECLSSQRLHADAPSPPASKATIKKYLKALKPLSGDEE